MLNTVLSPPIPPYQNVPIEPQFYSPRRFVISAISLGVTTVITTTTDQDYTVGQLVRLVIPQSFGTRALNGISAYVISIPSSTEVELDIFSIGLDPFIFSSNGTQAQILAIGDNNYGQINRHGRIHQLTFIPGSFKNISPN